MFIDEVISVAEIGLVALEGPTASLPEGAGGLKALGYDSWT